MDFDLGSFAEGLATAATATPLCWRDDPESSLSDWILRVDSPGANATYHVHRATLATGVRRSEYFARLFTGAGTSGLVENVQGGSTFQLEPSAANAFPAFLDFVYKGELAISDASAVALLHLAEYFLNRPLYDQVTTYLQTALKGAPGSEAGNRTTSSAPLFLAEAHLYALDKAADVCAKVCATHLLTRELGYCNELAPPLFLRVVEAVECTSPEQSIALSDHVAAFVTAHSPPLERLGPLPLIDVTMLEGLTAKLTAVSADSALDLLGHALARQGAERLQSECAKTIGAKWEGGLLPTIVSSLASKDEGTASGDQGSAWTPLGAGTYPAGLQFSLLSHALVHASTELKDLRSQLAVANALNGELKEKARALASRDLHSQQAVANARIKELKAPKFTYVSNGIAVDGSTLCYHSYQGCTKVTSSSMGHRYAIMAPGVAEGVFRWSVKVHLRGNRMPSWVFVGVIGTTAPGSDSHADSTSFGWAGRAGSSNGSCYKAGRHECNSREGWNGWQTGDTAELTLDCGKRTLSLKHDRTNKTYEMTNLPAGQPWYGHVNFSSGGFYVGEPPGRIDSVEMRALF